MPFRRRYRRLPSLKRIAALVLAVYVISFTPLGAIISPYLTSMGAWATGDYYFVGSGFYVNPHYVMTNYHVVQGCSAMKIRTLHGVFDVTRIRSNSAYDVAALYTKEETTMYSIFRGKPHREGEIAWFADYNSSPGAFSLIPAKVLKDDAYHQSNVWFSNRVRKGNSGTPLMDARGYVIGMVRSYNYTGNNPLLPEKVYNVAIGLPVLKYFLYSHAITYYELPGESYNLLDDTLLKENMAVGILCRRKPETISVRR